MKSSRTPVGTRALRAQLSAHLRAVARGEVVTISDRKRRPVARLVPVEHQREDEVLERLAGQGVLQRGTGKPGQRPAVRPKRKGRLVSDLVVEDRR